MSAYTADRRALLGREQEELSALGRAVQVERIDENRRALDGALARALESRSLEQAFERSGYRADDLRAMSRAGEWGAGVADAIYHVRSGLHRDTLSRNGVPSSAPFDRREAGQADRDGPDAPARSRISAEAEPATHEQDQALRESGRGRHDGAELADLFLQSQPDRRPADPRLAGAIKAQAVMERHIGEVFDGDATRIASANIESRQLISDALRRGFDVSVREPAPVRQIEPIQPRPELER